MATPNDQDGGVAQQNDTGFSASADFYAILNLPRESSLKNIQQSYRKISRSIHPDK